MSRVLQSLDFDEVFVVQPAECVENVFFCLSGFFPVAFFVVPEIAGQFV
jgi:hypothetical protein